MSNEFNMTRLAQTLALGEVFTDMDLSRSEIMYEMGRAHDCIPDLHVLAEYEGKTGAELMEVVTEFEKGFKSVMRVAYDAGKAGKVLV